MTIADRAVVETRAVHNLISKMKCKYIKQVNFLQEVCLRTEKNGSSVNRTELGVTVNQVGQDQKIPASVWTIKEPR